MAGMLVAALAVPAITLTIIALHSDTGFHCLFAEGMGVFAMTDKEQTDAFSNDLDKLVERYRQEFEMSYAQVVGTLQIKTHLLCVEAINREDEIQ